LDKLVDFRVGSDLSDLSTGDQLAEQDYTTAGSISTGRLRAESSTGSKPVRS